MSLWRISSCKLASTFKTRCSLVNFLTNSTTKRYHCFPRRTVMYVPAADERKLKKIPTLNADTVVIDFEDGVAFNQKEAARSNVLKGLKIASQSSCERVVRINGIDSNVLNEDLRSIFANSNGISHLHALMLPKCESKEHLHQLDFAVGFHARESIQKPLSLYIMIESPTALARLMEICECGTTNLKSLKLEAVVFGSDDYLAAIGSLRTSTSNELVFAKQSLVASVKAFGLQAIDVVGIDFKDLSALEVECLEGARIGFTGKQIIHPAQVEVVNKAFTPSAEMIEWAQGLINLFHEQQKSGKGAFVYKGKMIDKPLLLQAENIIRMSKA